MLAASNAAGDDLELNYYLESPAALQWILNRQCAVVVGSAPHNLYNEEVKYIFERRVALFLGAGRFLAHTLPNPYVYALTLSDLLHRQSRPARIAEYGRTSQALVADLHAHWIALGGPVVEDETPFVDVAAVLSRRLEPDVSMFYDEAGLPSPPLDAVSSMVEFVAYLETVLHSGLLVLDAEITHLQKEVDAAAATARGQATEIDRRDAMLAALAEERIAAVDLRDRRIDQLQNELEFMTKGWRRFVVRRR